MLGIIVQCQHWALGVQREASNLGGGDRVVRESFLEEVGSLLTSFNVCVPLDVRIEGL